MERLQSRHCRFKAGLSGPDGSTGSRKSDRTFAKMAGKIPACKDASKKWTMPIQNWKLAMNRFMIDFGDRLDDHR
ncbi:putative transposase [Glaesserella parasuis ZJ0906]|uniref:Putative transposase n=1 Tax=Glaesserella parasuis ZJ0906 TaxID=1322346 RepID=A0A806JBZ6_GLAPU|nr:putative transposase [Glaesserella parasuis ZJ0906]ATW44548.1 hypothetical protein A2U21_00355 [Glaesserella parasuis str. Nagasaki]EYE71388.1 putative transposase [Glaesserella parasuis str. Nagasaki]